MKVSYLNDEFFSRLETSALHLRANLAGFFGGKHLVKTYGQTVEFADYREYMLGDDIRRIDWNLYSRFEKYFLKLFTDERQMHTQIFLDCSGSLGKVNPAKAAYAVGFAAALGFLSIHNMDKLSFKLMKGEKTEDPFGVIVGKNTFFRIVSELENIEFGDETDLEKAILSCNDVGNNDGLTVIISDFFTDSNWKKAVDYLCYRKRQVLLIQILSPDEIDPAYEGRVHLLDAEAASVEDGKNIKLRITNGMLQAYSEALNDLIADIKSFCNSRGAQFVSVNCERPIEKEIFGNLLNIGLME